MKSATAFFTVSWQKMIRNIKHRGLSKSFVHLKRQLSLRMKYRYLDLWGNTGQDLFGTNGRDGENATPAVNMHNYRFESTKPFVFKEVFRNLEWNFNESTFIDFGSGKGAGLVYASAYHFKKLIGVEISQQLCDIAGQNMKIFTSRSKHKIDYEVVHTDAGEYQIPPESDCFYFFNPFDATILEQVIKNILASLEKKSRKILIIYINALHNEVMKKYSFKEIKCISADLLDVYLDDYKIYIYTNPENS